ncbi:hypothetical protein BLKGLAD_70720 (plasmid) [Burkholderia gladioli pv. gladioli]
MNRYFSLLSRLKPECPSTAMPLPLAGSSRAYTPFYRTEAVATSPEVSLSALAHDFYPTLIQRSSAISAPSRYGGQDPGRFGKAARRQQADEWPQGRIDTPDKLRPILRSHQVGSRHELRRNPASSRGSGDHRDLCFATIAHAGNRAAVRAPRMVREHPHSVQAGGAVEFGRALRARAHGPDTCHRDASVRRATSHASQPAGPARRPRCHAPSCRV